MDLTAVDNSKSVLLIGGPDAGKSNFLFRLWLAIDDGGGALQKYGLPSDVNYLREGAERLLEGEFAGHTSQDVHEQVTIPVKSTFSGAAPGLLIVPDVSGEQVLTISRDRAWSPAWEELISRQCACLLFVRAGSDEIIAPLDWAACFETYGAVIETTTEQTEPSELEDVRDPIEPESTDEKLADLPTQVVLTEWLQFLRRAFTDVTDGNFRPRMGVIVAAWDAVPVDQQSLGPVTYLRDNFPMLHQFIEANEDRFDFQVFGVSVVGGDLKNDNEFKETYLRSKPQDFGFVLHSIGQKLTRSSDMTLPVAWALQLLEEPS